jgi:hypothetical protein
MFFKNFSSYIAKTNKIAFSYDPNILNRDTLAKTIKNNSNMNKREIINNFEIINTYLKYYRIKTKKQIVPFTLYQLNHIKPVELYNYIINNINIAFYNPYTKQINDMNKFNIESYPLCFLNIYKNYYNIAINKGEILLCQNDNLLLDKNEEIKIGIMIKGIKNDNITNYKIKNINIENIKNINNVFYRINYEPKSSIDEFKNMYFIMNNILIKPNNINEYNYIINIK